MDRDGSTVILVEIFEGLDDVFQVFVGRVCISQERQDGGLEGPDFVEPHNLFLNVKPYFAAQLGVLYVCFDPLVLKQI